MAELEVRLLLRHMVAILNPVISRWGLVVAVLGVRLPLPMAYAPNMVEPGGHILIILVAVHCMEEQAVVVVARLNRQLVQLVGQPIQ